MFVSPVIGGINITPIGCLRFQNKIFVNYYKLASITQMLYNIVKCLFLS